MRCNHNQELLRVVALPASLAGKVERIIMRRRGHTEGRKSSRKGKREGGGTEYSERSRCEERAMAEMFNCEGRLEQDRRQDMQGEVASVQPRVEASALLDPFFGFRIYGSCRCGRGEGRLGVRGSARASVFPVCRFCHVPEAGVGLDGVVASVNIVWACMTFSVDGV